MHLFRTYVVVEAMTPKTKIARLEKELSDLKSTLDESLSLEDKSRKRAAELAELSTNLKKAVEQSLSIVHERDAEIRKLTAEALIRASDFETVGARFVELENERDVLSHVVRELRPKAEELSAVKDNCETLMAALKRLTRG